VYFKNGGSSGGFSEISPNIYFQTNQINTLQQVPLRRRGRTFALSLFPSISLFSSSPPFFHPSFLFLYSFTSYRFQQHLQHSFWATTLHCMIYCAPAKLFRQLSCGVMGFDVSFALSLKSSSNFCSLLTPMVLLVCGFLLLLLFSLYFRVCVVVWLLS
jgi:hypothetical protein